MPNVLPRDSDGNALRQLVLDGSDLSKPMEIDFAVDVPDRDRGIMFAAAVEHIGFRTKVSKDDSTGTWTCYCTKTMIPVYDEIIAIQNRLDKLSKPFDGKSDGWGSFGNADKNALK